ncbi:Tetratricopeptide repeat protein [Planctomycetes bacterium Pan216]|uniref:Tetratricopeptide repeat protein n=1 Tax=Kolteria novifilia TaxID=2527975 RepID=A0A518B0I0_9BACT|nr:Tetratricopeptide repeat protein [Planctomycetes bacterium Pan216]
MPRLLVGTLALFGGTFLVSADESPSTASQKTKKDPVRSAVAGELSSQIDPPSANLYPGFDGYTRKVTTDSDDAQRWFNQGIQLLYGYNHDEAIRSFEKAAEIDPSCAMAWWGSAYARGLHINNPEMTEEQSKLAHEAATKAMNALDNEAPVEKALVEAVSKRYALPVPEDRSSLDQAYADAMESVWHRFPNDPDVGALYAESLMNLQPWDLWTHEGAPKGRTLEIVAVLERTLAKMPEHPGANHFYIHAIEASPWPEKGVPSAERLREMVPGSGHLVHMPSHIYIRVGRYGDAADANERAIKADESYFAKAPEPDFYSLYFLHNVHFLAYAAMMEGRYDLALESARKIEESIPPQFLEKYVTLADGFMPTSLYVMIRFGKWHEILAEPEPPTKRLFSRAEWHFARAVALAALGKTHQARDEIDQLDEVASKLTDEWKMGNNKAEEVIAIARTMAMGEILFREGKTKKAFKRLRKAVAMEEMLRYDEPPGWMQPVRHALGALLLADGRDAEAEEVYRADLVRHPNNAWSLLGLEQSLRKQGKTAKADKLAAQVKKAWSRSDVAPVASCYCHPNARTSNTKEIKQAEPEK